MAKIAVNRVEQVSDMLQRSKPKHEGTMSVKDAIRALYDDVADAIMNKGYEAREVYAKVAKKLEISDETVKAYYNDIRKEKAQEQKVTSLASHREKAAGKASSGKAAKRGRA